MTGTGRPGAAPAGDGPAARETPAAELPRVVIAAPASGSGKTTVATGLMAALRRRGTVVSGHKVGPDYIDPSFHALACGRPGRNLDPWLVGEQRVAPLLLHGALTPVPADIAVVEGVMGLYDGVGGDSGFASTAHVATLLDAPVVVVLDVTAQARTAAAVVLGLRVFDPAVRVAGVVLNRVGSGGHEHLVRTAMAEVGVPVVGAIPLRREVAAPSRHLGLIPAAEHTAESVAVVEALADLVGETVDLDAVVALARSAPPLRVRPWDPATELGGARGRTGATVTGAGDGPGGEDGPGGGGAPGGEDGPGLRRTLIAGAGAGAGSGGVRVAVAGGAAFTFGYTETVELLVAAGAEVVTFDPLADAALPSGTGAVVIGGGFPEVHAEALSANAALRAELAAFDGPVMAECAGLLYLGRSLDGVPMVGRLPVVGHMTPRLRLGYREATAESTSAVAVAGEVVRGHEFHRTRTEPAHGPSAAWRWNGGRHGFVDGRVHASYLHVHWAGHPSVARRLVQACDGGAVAGSPVAPVGSAAGEFLARTPINEHRSTNTDQQ